MSTIHIKNHFRVIEQILDLTVVKSVSSNAKVCLNDLEMAFNEVYKHCKKCDGDGGWYVDKLKTWNTCPDCKGKGILKKK